MAYVELDGDEKPRFEKTLVRDLPHDVIQQFCMMMNPTLPFKDYRSLAGKMELKYLYVKNLDRRENPTEELLQHWWSGKGSKTVTDLIDLLMKIDRHDAIDELRPHEWTVIPNRTRPISAVSNASSTNKVPCENDSSDLSAYMTSDDEDRRLSRSAGSLPYSEEPSSYRSNPSDALTVCADDYDTDEELNQKMANMDATETDDASYHPLYQFRGREDSNASTSTAGSVNTSVSTNTGSIQVDMGIQTDESISVHRVDVHPRPPSLPSPMEGDIAPPYFSGQPPIVASDKLALVIGNQSYKKLPPDEVPLMFPHKDVFDFTNALNDLGFKVLSLVDLTLTEMRTVMLAFCKLLGPGVFAVFYYAGHGYEENGENYLMPVDVSPARSANEFIAAQEILREMQLTQTALNLLIIDACRVKGVNTTDESISCGLQRGTAGNTIIAYSCQSQMPAFENQDQLNGVYMTELLASIKQDRRIENILMDVNSAVNRNPHVIQRPVFESDAIRDCRLTCKIDPRANFNLWHTRSNKWCDATTPPDPQTFPREEEKVDFMLKYKTIFSNVLQINVHMKNRNTLPVYITDVQLLNGAGLEMNVRSVENIVQPGLAWTEIQHFRIKDLQKISSKLLLVIQLKSRLGNRVDLIELKLNADYPLISSYLNEFIEWITADVFQGTKNTWV